MKIVEIKWLDHASYYENTWRSHEELLDLDPPLVSTVGFLIEERENAYIVAGTMGKLDNPLEDRNFGGEMCILKGTVEEMRVLVDE